MTGLTVAIPTFNRADVLGRTLDLLDEQAAELDAEILLVDDGSSDATPEVAAGHEHVASAPFRVLRQENRGPAAARNRALEEATGTVCMFSGDDIWPREGLLRRHLEFHRANPGRGAALVGKVVPTDRPEPSPFERWLEASYMRFDYPDVETPTPVPAHRFYTSNVSAKAALLKEVGGFDEAFDDAAYEDIELGYRLERRGVELIYDPAAVAEHYHPTDLATELRRQRRSGVAGRLLSERAPEWQVPRNPGWRYRAGAPLLTVLTAARVPRTRELAWRFLSHQALREAYWGIDPSPGCHVRSGARLETILRSRGD